MTKNFKTFNHKWEYTLDAHIKIRKGGNRHKTFSQVYKNYSILTSVFYLVIRYLNSCSVTTDVTFNGSLNITTCVWAFFLLADYYFIIRHQRNNICFLMPDQAATARAHGVVQRGRERAAVQAAEQCATSQCPFNHLGPRQLLTVSNHSGPGGANVEFPFLILKSSLKLLKLSIDGSLK